MHIKDVRGSIPLLKDAVGDVIVLPASKIAAELGNVRAQNICLLGALVTMLELRDINWEDIITENVPPKLLDINLRAFRAGRDLCVPGRPTDD